MKICHNFLTLKLFQTYINFLLLNTKEDILKNMCNQTVDGHHTIEVNGVHQLFGY